MAKRPTFGIFPKVLLTMIAVGVIPLGAIWYVNQRSAVERIESSVDQQLGRHERQDAAAERGAR